MKRPILTTIITLNLLLCLLLLSATSAHAQGCATPSFAPAANYATAASPRSVTTGDFNGDGKLDLAVANANSNNVSILLGNGVGGFGAAANYATAALPRSVAVGDFNGDGKPDLVTASYTNPGYALVRLGDGNGGFGDPNFFGAGNGPFSVAVGDFNGDGKPDLAVANESSDNVSVLLNTTPPCNTAPTASCTNVTVSAGASCTANASINNGSSDPDSGDTLTLSQSPAGPYPLGTTTVTLTVTDSHGAASSCQSVVTVVDQTAPTITCPANITTYLPLNSLDIAKLVSFPTPTAADNCGSASVTTSKASGSSFPLGTTTVTATATDGSGNTRQCSFTVTVLYNFSGFFQPVDNSPIVNAVTAGSSIPVKFSLSGNKGLNIFAAGYPQSAQIACSGGTPDDIEETVTAGASSLSYDATTDRYNYVWKTDKTWKGTCRKLILKFIDGSTREALFQFK